MSLCISSTNAISGSIHTSMKKILLLFFVCMFFSLFVAACGDTAPIARSNSASSTNSANGPNQVHMNDADFVQQAITIRKGDKITLVDDVSIVHYIFNGEWDSNGKQKQVKEPGAPQVQLQFQGNDKQQIGPFNTAGTFHFYCSIHPGMNLTVTVQ